MPSRKQYGDDFENQDERTSGTQPLDSTKAGAKDKNVNKERSDRYEEGRNDPRTKEEKDLSDKELTLKRQREQEQKDREEASREYEEKMAEEEERIAKQYEESGEERPDDPNKPPEACEQFEGYGEFFVNKDMNIRHQDRRRGDRVALNWEDYQALRDQKIYLQPVPKEPEQERPEATPL